VSMLEAIRIAVDLTVGHGLGDDRLESSVN